MPRSRRLVCARTGFAAVLTALISLTSVVPAAAAPRPTPPTLFGIHDPNVNLTTWPQTSVGSIRFWDTGTTWRDIQPTSSTHGWQVAHLDQMVKASVDHRTDRVIVLGGTPAWASSRAEPGAGNPPAFLGTGAADPPKAAAWATYVKFMVNRYKSKGVHQYQVWNEPNVIAFWNGTPAQMATLSNQTVKLIKSIDPHAAVIAPSFPLRLPTQKRWFEAYAKTGALKNVDAISVQLYPLANQGPEQMVDLLGWAKKILGKYHVSKPIWDTEINYGMSGGGQKSKTFSPALSAAYVARTYLLSQANGASRAYWYMWSPNQYTGVRTTRADGSLTPAGDAFVTTKKWMAGQVLLGCMHDWRNTYRCQIKTGNTYGWVFWNAGAYRPVITAPVGTYQVEYLDGSAHKAKAKDKIKMGQAPILIRAHR